MTYYYDCPIKAAYMVREFGIEIAEPVGFDPIALNPKDVDDLLRQLTKEGWGVDDGKIYVAPDSLHIFEPQVGDVVSAGDCVTSIVMLEDFEPEEIEAFKIIQRNNKAFIWPESE